MATTDAATPPDPDSEPPSVPILLPRCPTVAGLIVPWIGARRSGERVLFGAVDHDRLVTALRRWLCGVCGEPLQERLVLMMRLSDPPRRATTEPSLHPWCAAYSTKACSMLAGRMSCHRASGSRLGDTMRSAPDSPARYGALAEPWFAVWLSGYTLTTDHGRLAASSWGLLHP